MVSGTRTLAADPFGSCGWRVGTSVGLACCGPENIPEQFMFFGVVGHIFLDNNFKLGGTYQSHINVNARTQVEHLNEMFYFIPFIC